MRPSLRCRDAWDDVTKSPLESPALGASLSACSHRVVMRCDRPNPHRRIGVRIGVTLSGGGFRATFAGLGVVRYLADAGLLGDLRFVSSVSGGSVANGMIATRFSTAARPWLQRRGVRRVGDRAARQAGERALAEVEAGPQHLAGDRQTEPDRCSGLGVRRLVVRRRRARALGSRMSVDLQRRQPHDRGAVRVRT